jgi:hypothetical protein
MAGKRAHRGRVKPRDEMAEAGLQRGGPDQPDLGAPHGQDVEGDLARVRHVGAQGDPARQLHCLPGKAEGAVRRDPVPGDPQGRSHGTRACRKDQAPQPGVCRKALAGLAQ